VSLAFLRPGAGVAARSPLHAATAAAGATFEVRDGWEVAVRFGTPDAEAAAVARSVGWADLSHVRKTEIHAPEGGLRITPDRALVLGEPADGLDVTAQYGALLLAGPAARDRLARFCALDLRPHVAPPGAFRPGSVARTPGFVLVEAADRFLLLFGAAYGPYMWEVVADAGEHLGGRPVGVDAVREEVSAGA
jgi:glycine cleavage system aminomethyltransferase T